MESISDIKNRLAETDDESLPLVMSLYAGDDRAGVKKALEGAQKRYDKLLAEKKISAVNVSEGRLSKKSARKRTVI